uniref:Single domain-containing protein n=1 Tax=Daphnia galeata TaxID=27404 RepID=A0A8J2RRF5_9CRUS|nr:unnamed protein product [Daphnia galeata]
MNFSITSVFLVVMTFVNAQNLDSMEVETRDNPSAFLREKRQIPVIDSIPQLATTILHPSFGCFWSGTSPFCIPDCGTKYQKVLTDSRGDGKLCWTGNKNLCCPLPAGMVKVKG